MINIDALLEPISDAAPCGEDLSFSSEFDAIQESRRSDDATLDQGEWITELKSADWAAVTQQCEKLLSSRSKDLRLAVWVAEACTRTQGFAGLADGYRLVARLCERYWEHIHPEAEEADQELRVGNLSWLLNQSVRWIHAIALTNAPEGRYDATAVEVAARGHHDDAPVSDAHPDAARIDAARMATPFEFYQQLASAIPQAREALSELEAVVDSRLGQHGPSFSATRDALESVSAVALRMAASAGAVQHETFVTSSPPVVEQVAAALIAPARTHGDIATRQEALLQLRRVADFFRRTEPHSPVAYLADKAARWGNMPLHVWLKTVLKDNPALGQLEELLDIGTEQSGTNN
ncbi:MAG: type VI secretion system protein TssA [Rhodanobacter sp.]